MKMEIEITFYRLAIIIILLIGMLWVLSFAYQQWDYVGKLQAACTCNAIDRVKENLAVKAKKSRKENMTVVKANIASTGWTDKGKTREHISSRDASNVHSLSSLNNNGPVGTEVAKGTAAANGGSATSAITDAGVYFD